MTLNGWIQILVFCGLVAALVRPLGGAMTRIFEGGRNGLSPVLRPVERLVYRLAGGLHVTVQLPAAPRGTNARPPVESDRSSMEPSGRNR